MRPLDQSRSEGQPRAIYRAPVAPSSLLRDFKPLALSWPMRPGASYALRVGLPFRVLPGAGGAGSVVSGRSLDSVSTTWPGDGLA